MSTAVVKPIHFLKLAITFLVIYKYGMEFYYSIQEFLYLEEELANNGYSFYKRALGPNYSLHLTLSSLFYLLLPLLCLISLVPFWMKKRWGWWLMLNGIFMLEVLSYREQLIRFVTSFYRDFLPSSWVYSESSIWQHIYVNIPYVLLVLLLIPITAKHFNLPYLKTLKRAFLLILVYVSLLLLYTLWITFVAYN